MRISDWSSDVCSSDLILDHQYAPTLVFQVDLFPAEGATPTTWFEAAAREKDIRYSSRTRMTTDMLMQRRKLQTALATLLDRLPPDMQDAEDVKMLCAAAREMPVSDRKSTRLTSSN